MKCIEHNWETASKESIGNVKFDLDLGIKVIHRAITTSSSLCIILVHKIDMALALRQVTLTFDKVTKDHNASH